MKEEDGAGCILAHCMGLGKTLSVSRASFVSDNETYKVGNTKTCMPDLSIQEFFYLQTISFVHTLLNNFKKTKMNTCLIVCPLNTVLNWVNEWTMWFDKKDQFDVNVTRYIQCTWILLSLMK